MHSACKRSMQAQHASAACKRSMQSEWAVRGPGSPLAGRHPAHREVAQRQLVTVRQALPQESLGTAEEGVRLKRAPIDTACKRRGGLTWPVHASAPIGRGGCQAWPVRAAVGWRGYVALGTAGGCCVTCWAGLQFLAAGCCRAYLECGRADLDLVGLGREQRLEMALHKWPRPAAAQGNQGQSAAGISTRMQQRALSKQGRLAEGIRAQCSLSLSLCLRTKARRRESGSSPQERDPPLNGIGWPRRVHAAWPTPDD